jgi:hypothetical protein
MFARNRSKSSGHSAECKSCVKEYNKKHVAENAEYYQAERKRKRHANLAWYLFLECRTRAKRNGVEFDLSPADIVIPEHCPVFGFVLKPAEGKLRDSSPSVDRINTERGYVRGNVQVISYKANRMKTNATGPELLQFARWILANQNLRLVKSA